ncbi:putative diguanylate cyclase YcdT [Grimontia celer]|uniref:diguanylate cyclase n=1 Tax=Grimontia celer TaxID=1796497 RepID=A0A128F7T7_9GAMM|nr:diguanylate cyclase [Grimontia celer]CZF82832.1 putative diguanylate cyclase YcdT [Grimontia celer]
MARGSTAWAAVVTLIFFLASFAGTTPFNLHDANIAQVSIASGIGMIGCLYGGIRTLLALIFASTLAFGLAIYSWDPTAPLIPALVTGAVMPLACYLSAQIWKNLFSNGGVRFETLKHYVLQVCILPGFLVSLVAASDSLYGSYTGKGGYFYDLYELTSTYALGILLVAPFYQLWRLEEDPFRQFSRNAILSIVLYLTLTILAFIAGAPGLIFVAPVIPLILAFKGEELASLAALFGMGIIVTTIAPYNLGPFDLPNKVQGHASLLTYVLMSVITPLAIGLHVRRLNVVSRSRDKWQSKARTDQLTGLPNRYAFFPELAKQFEHASKQGKKLVVAMIDVDHFKMVNDTYGHAFGDVVLMDIALLMQEEMRDSDLLARVGGEEFAILFPGTNEDQAFKALERLRTRCESHISRYQDVELSITISIGAAVFKSPEPKDSLLGRADSLLYQAKEDGRNRTIIS